MPGHEYLSDATSLPSAFGCRRTSRSRQYQKLLKSIQEKNHEDHSHSLLFALPLLFAPGAFAQHQTFTVNPDASPVAFTLGGTGHYVHGTFHVQSGSVEFDRSAQKISGSVIVVAAQRQQRREEPR